MAYCERRRKWGMVGDGSPRLLLAYDGDAVPDGQHHDVDALVRGDTVVERADRNGVVVVRLGVDDTPGPQDVVDEQDSVGTQARDQFLVVADVIRLVGID